MRDEVVAAEAVATHSIDTWPVCLVCSMLPDRVLRQLQVRTAVLLHTSACDEIFS